ncbi:MAG TPA: hypothetical protein ENI93_03715 [Gammaproteobacteria bacterium]|nr:hypothetical protein [Gammaproteobacteria bacterium]
MNKYWMMSLALMSLSGLVRAECPQSMPNDELVDCIVVEGSGEDYVEWKARFETDYREHQAELKRQAESPAGEDTVARADQDKP